MIRTEYNDLDTLLQQYPLDTITYEQIRFMYGTGRDNSVYAVGRDNRRHLQNFRYRNGVQTPIGDIAETVWYALAVKLVYRNHEGWLLDDLEEFYKQHGDQRYIATYTEKIKEREAVKSAVYSAIQRHYDDAEWWGYLPFNWKYRPRELADKTFPLMVYPCCNYVEQVSFVREHTRACPNCKTVSEPYSEEKAPFDEALLRPEYREHPASSGSQPR